MSYLGGMLANACAEVRQELGEPSTSQKVTNALILRKIPDAWCALFRDLQMESEKALALPFSYTLSGSVFDERFLLPATCTIVRVVELLDSAGNILTRLDRRRPTDESQYNYGFDLIGPEIRVVRPEGHPSQTLRILFEPGSYAPVHWGSIADAQVDQAADPQTVQPNASTLTAGFRDDRPNAYIGMYFRVYGTNGAPTGYTNTANNVQEILVSNFAQATQKCSLQKALTFTDAFAWSYEMVPTVNWDVWRAIVLRVCRMQANSMRRYRQAQSFNGEYQSLVRSIRLGEAYADAVTPPRFWQTGGYGRRPYYMRRSWRR